MTTNPWIWVGAICTIAIFTYLWRENPLYRLAEHVLVGVSVGYSICIIWFNALYPRWWVPLVHDNKYVLIIPTFMAIFMLFRFSKKYGWISFWPLAFIIGFAGYAIPTTIDADMLIQVQATVNVPLSGNWFSVFSSLIIFIGTLACLIYFYFSFPHTGVVGKISKFGSMLLMISFGASFGYTVMARISLVLGRIMFLLRDWLGLVT